MVTMMIEILDSPDHVAAFRVVGTLKTDDYERMIPQIEQRLGEHEQIGVLVDMTALEDMTAGALRTDIKYGLEKLEELHRFRRAGVISDKQWVDAAMTMARTFFPQIETRVFTPDEKEEAMQWVADFR